MAIAGKVKPVCDLPTMHRDHLKIGFVRRGYSRSGGAEAYLKRLGEGLHSLGHEALLITTDEWPDNEWQFGAVTRVRGSTPIEFANAVESAPVVSDVLMSLERVWRCNVMRAGDGVHRAWLERREGALARLRIAFNPKHRAILRLEESLYARGGAERVIANSEMVKREIATTYSYPAERIDVVRNGVPLDQFRFTPEERERSRKQLGLTSDQIAVLFVGSGWERKGLRFAIAAVEKLKNPKLQLLVAGRGNASAGRGIRFLGEVADVAALYCAADIFVLPTLYDPFSNACLEALASGLPVITTASNGFSEIIEDGGHGSIVETNADSVAEAIRYWSDEGRRTAARPQILERASQFDISRNVARTLEILVQSAASAVSTSGKIRKT
ncbi:MAG: glycosyltransferase family 4 protein [Chthoniobacterales bacterium]